MFNYPVSFMSSGGYATNLSYPNMAYSGLLPTMYTNYGGDLQVTNINPYGGYNLGLMFNPIASQTWGMPSIFSNAGMSAEAQDLSAATQRAQSILAPIYNNMASGSINQATQAIQSSITKLEAKLAAEGTTEEEKTAIQETINKLKEQAEKLDNLKKSTDLDPQTAYEQARDISNEVNKILSDAAKAAAESEKAKADEKKDDETAKADEKKDDGTAKADDAEKADDTKPDEKKDDTKAEESGKKQGATDKPDNYSFDIEDDASDFYEAISGLGTDDDIVKDIIERNAVQGTLVDVMLCWNRDQAQNDDESFVEAFMADADHGEAKELLPIILRSLVLEAQELGIDEASIQECRRAVKKELGHGALAGMDDPTICENIDKLLKLIAEKRGSIYGSKDLNTDN